MIDSKSRLALITATIMALVMIVVFWIFSSGWSLRLTFVPGVILAYILFLLTIKRKAPAPQRLLPLYLIAVAVQMLHFAEEYLTGFYAKFPALFGGAAYSPEVFVAFNMSAYFAFIIGAVFIYKKTRPLMMIPLFFITYGVLGNAITHVIFAIYVGGYFPGLYTALIYWLLAPFLLRELWNGTR